MKKNENNKEKQRQELDVQISEVQQQYSCCDSKLFSIPDRRKWIFTLLLINIPAILHQIFHVQWFSHNHLFGALYVLFFSHFINFWAFMNICVQDPGFIQKIKYGYEIDEAFIQIPKNQNINNYVVISYVVPNKQMNSRLKLCTTCNIYRPSRASHCNDCGVCVERMDHHCPWIGTCVGKRNHKFFYLFLLSLIILTITTIVMCIMILVGTQEDDQVFSGRLKRYPMALVFIIVPCLPALFLVGIMFVFHSYLIATDLTTKQYLDKKWSPNIGNPQRKNICFKNILKLLFKTQQKKTKYRHQVFAYYNQQVDSSTDKQKNSKSSDQENQQKNIQNPNNAQSSQQSMHNNVREFQKQNVQQRGNANDAQTQQKIHLEN